MAWITRLRGCTGLLCGAGPWPAAASQAASRYCKSFSYFLQGPSCRGPFLHRPFSEGAECVVERCVSGLHFGGGAVEDHASAIDEDDAAGHGFDLLQDVCREQDGLVAAELADGLADHPALDTHPAGGRSRMVLLRPSSRMVWRTSRVWL